MTESARPESLSDQQLLQRGFAALNRGQLESASECCRVLLGRRPDLVPAHFLVGLTALEAGQRKTAYSAFRSVTRLEPAHAAAWAQLARLLMTEGQVNRADQALAEALRHVRDEPIVHDLIGIVYSLMGEHGRAGTHFARANELQQGHPPFMLNLANNYVYHGDTKAANQVFAEIVRIQPNSPQAHWSLSGAAKAIDTGHIEEMRALLKRRLHPRAQAFYHYAIGKELEDLEQWDEAFEAFAAGAAARRETVEYDEQAESQMFAYLEEHYFPERISGHGNPSTAPIFILGQPRTGTTLIDRIISSHSQVHAAGELQQFSLALRRLSDHRDPKRFSAKLFAEALELDPARVGTLYLETTRRMQGNRPRFTDKLPQNYLMIPLILAALPNAKIVHLVRDPMDACFSSFKQLFADAYLHSYDQREMARHHARYRQLMHTWRERWPGRFLDISYEQTVQHFEPSVRTLLEFLELPFESQCLQFYRNDATVATASAVQVRQPVHTRSVGRWKHYRQQLGPMRSELLAAGIDPGP